MPIAVIQPDATAGVDTAINGNSPTFNYGVRTDNHIGYTTASSEQYRMLIKFDVSPYNGKSIQQAILSLYCYNRSAVNTTTINFHRALTQWFEGNTNGAAPGAGVDGSTWNLRNANGSLAWGAAGGQSATDYAATQTASTAVLNINQWYTWDVTADVRLFTSGTTNHGWWGIASGGFVSNNRKFFYMSDEGTNTTLRPMLTINYNMLNDVGRNTGRGVMRGVMRGVR